MYYCNSCKQKFEEPEKSIEVHREIDYSNIERYDVCPYCGDSDFEELERCEICGKWKRSNETCLCYADIGTELDNAINVICLEFDCDRDKLADAVDVWFNSRF